MDLSRLLQMVMNMVLRKAVNHGMKAGMDAISRRGAAKGGAPQPGSADTAKRAQETAKLMRRIGR